MPCECKHCKTERNKEGAFTSKCRYEDRRNTRMVTMVEDTTTGNITDAHGDDGDGDESPIQ